MTKQFNIFDRALAMLVASAIVASVILPVLSMASQMVA